MIFFRALLAVILVHCSAGQRWVKLCDMINSTEWEQTNNVASKNEKGKSGGGLKACCIAPYLPEPVEVCMCMLFCGCLSSSL